MSGTAGPLVVLGIGNVLLRDEGVGVEVVRALERLVDRGAVELPAGTRLLDGGTLGLDLLPEISEARAVLLVDAIDLGRAPGSVEAIAGEALRAAPAGSFPERRGGVEDLLVAAQLIGALPDAIGLVGVQPSEIGVGSGLTDVVRGAIPAALRVTVQELERLEASAARPGWAADDRHTAEAAP